MYIFLLGNQICLVNDPPFRTDSLKFYLGHGKVCVIALLVIYTCHPGKVLQKLLLSILEYSAEVHAARIKCRNEFHSETPSKLDELETTEETLRQIELVWVFE